MCKVLPYAFMSLGSVLKKYPSKFIGCCLANPAEDGTGVKELENLILKVFETFNVMLIRFYFGAFKKLPWQSFLLC